MSSSAQVTIRKPANFKQPSGHKLVLIFSIYYLSSLPTFMQHFLKTGRCDCLDILSTSRTASKSDCCILDYCSSCPGWYYSVESHGRRITKSTFCFIFYLLIIHVGSYSLTIFIHCMQMGFFERQRYPQDEGLAEEIPTPGEENSEENSVDPDTEQPNA